MKTEKRSELVDTAILLDREVRAKAKELKAIKALLIEEAEEHPELLQDIGENGKGITYFGNDGCVARVCFPSDSLKGEIDPTAKGGLKAMERLGNYKDVLLKPRFVYEPVEKFRDLVRNFFKPKEAAKILKAFSKDTKPRVSFETKDGPAVSSDEDMEEAA